MDFLPFIEILFIRSSILIVLTGLILIVLGNRLSANIRQAILSFALLGLLLLPVITVIVPDFSVRDLFTHSSSSNQQTTLMYLDSVELNPEDSGALQTLSDGALISNLNSNFIAKSNPSTGEEISFTYLVFIIWGSGVVLLSIWLLLSILRIQHITQTAKYTMLSNNIPWMSDLLNDLQLKRSVRIAYSDKVSIPMVWGLFYPTLLLPLSARQWGRARLRTLLLHEFAHIRRWDYLPHLLGKVVTGIYWMNPLVWFAAVKMGEEQEKACDNHVLAAGTPSHVYAQHLLDFMKWLRQQNGRRLVPAMTMGFKTRKVKERMHVLLDETTRRKTVSFASLFFLSIITGCAILPLATLNRGDNGMQFNGENTSYFIEAENTDLPEGILTQPDIYASGEKFIRVKDNVNSRENPPVSGSLKYKFRVTELGTYAIWARTKTDHSNEDSFWVRMDGEEWIKWNDIRKSDTWKWDTVRDWDKNERPVLYRLDRGEHTLELAYREENISLDKLLITNKINYRPEGKDPVLPARDNEVIRIPGTAGQIDAHFRTRKGDGAINGEYLISTRQKKELNEPPSKADAAFKFRVSKNGKYHIWARVMAESGSENSFWIRVNDKPWILLNGFKKDGSWKWEQVYDYRGGAGPVVFDLKKGSHTVEIAHRERNAGLDEIVITDIPGFYPRALDTHRAGSEIIASER
jgi:beta-lactamase regulating signal transducer with metallopeptidase domain